MFLLKRGLRGSAKMGVYKKGGIYNSEKGMRHTGKMPT